MKARVIGVSLVCFAESGLTACTQSPAARVPALVHLDIGLFRLERVADDSALGARFGGDLLVDQIEKAGHLEIRARSVRELGVDTTFSFARTSEGKTEVRVVASLHRVVGKERTTKLEPITDVRGVVEIPS